MIKIFSDAATSESLRLAASNPLIDGVTTNPSLLRKAGISNYRYFVEEALDILSGKPLSVEVVSGDLDGILLEAIELHGWAPDLYIKVPVVLPGAGGLGSVIKTLALEGVKLNVTAVMTGRQCKEASESLVGSSSAILSIFAGRIADTLVDPSPLFAEASGHLQDSGIRDRVELLWASTRQIFDVKTAEDAGADIITVAPDLLEKLRLRNKDLEEYSRETVQMFMDDAAASGLTIRG